MNLRYTCQADKAISVVSGDNKLKLERSQSLDWTPGEAASPNLVIGERKILIWPRQPYGSQERFLSVFRATPSDLNAQDQQNIEMGLVGETRSQVLQFSISDSSVGEVQVTCRISM